MLRHAESSVDSNDTSSKTAGPRPIRACYLIDGLAIGGTEKQLLALISNLDRRRVQPYLCLLDGSSQSSRALEPRDCPVLRLEIRSLATFHAARQAWRFVRWLRKSQIDLVQLHFPDSTYFGAPLARLAGVQCIRTRRNTGYWLTRRHRWLGRIVSRLVDGTIANSESCRQAVIEQEGARPESVHVIPNGIDLDRFHPRDRSSPSNSVARKRVGIVANLRPVKNLDLFLRAAAILKERYSDLTFCIAGDGELRPHLEEITRQLGLDECVHFAGRVDDIPSLLNTFDVAVLTSDSEGFSNALLEYMAAGLPIVATDIDGTREVIEHGVNGLLVPPDNADSLAHAIENLLVDPTIASRLALKALQKSRQRYSRATELHRYASVYQELFDKPRS